MTKICVLRVLYDRSFQLRNEQVKCQSSAVNIDNVNKLTNLLPPLASQPRHMKSAYTHQ